MRVKKIYRMHEILKRFKREYKKATIKIDNSFPFLDTISLYSYGKEICMFMVDVETNNIFGNFFTINKESKFIKFLNVLNEKKAKILI